MRVNARWLSLLVVVIVASGSTMALSGGAGAVAPAVQGISGNTITVGGIGTLVAVSTVFLYLLWVTIPLLKPSKVVVPMIAPSILSADFAHLAGHAQGRPLPPEKIQQQSQILALKFF